jgi:transcriptional regulator PpsR
VKHFLAPARWFGKSSAEDAAMVLSASCDIALILSADDHGVIKDLSFGTSSLPEGLQEKWIGQRWRDTVNGESGSRIDSLLGKVASGSSACWLQVTHVLEGGKEAPVLYAVIRMGNGNQLLASGRCAGERTSAQQKLVAAQQSFEHQHARIRDLRARHQLVFELATDAMLVVDAVSGKIESANPAAGLLLGRAPSRLLGRRFPGGLVRSGQTDLESAFLAVRTTGSRNGIQAIVGVDEPNECLVSITQFRDDDQVLLLVRLVPVDGNPEKVRPDREPRVAEVVRRMPDAFVVTDPGGRVLVANNAFLDLVQLSSEGQVQSESIDRWMGQPGVDFGLLRRQLTGHGAVRRLVTTLRGERGAVIDVEICGIAVAEGRDACCGFTIRDVSSRTELPSGEVRDELRSVRQRLEMVGRVPLKSLVQEAAESIEKRCIEAALESTNDNKASAAEVLGLSRQSLYSKMRRYGLGDLDPRADQELDKSDPD